MIYISHRGNLNGPNKLKENHPRQIQDVLKLGYHVEVDVHVDRKEFYLGHDKPTYRVTPKFLMQENLIIHAKNNEALKELSILNNVSLNLHYFWHQEDKYTLTSEGFIWTYPGEPILDTGKDIAVKPENHKKPALELLRELELCYGICSDYIADFRKYLGKV